MTGNKGFTLIEILIAVLILGIVLTTVYASYTGTFRIVQEAITNMVKYSEATTAWIFLEYKKDSLSVAIKDNGKGFDAGVIMADSARKGLGLLGVQERAHLLGGTFAVQSAPGRGTVITVEIPLKGGAYDGD